MEKERFLKLVTDFSFDLKRAFTLYIEKEIDLTYPQWRVMKTIRYSEADISAKEIADQLGFSKVTIADIVNRLETKDYIVKTPDPKDKRRAVLSISEKAHSMCQSVMCIEQQFRETLFEDMNDAEIKQYMMMTEKLLERTRGMGE